MATVCEGYLGVHVSRENFIDIQQVIRGLVDELPEEGFTPGSLIPTGPKGLPLWFAKMKKPRTGWLARYQP